MSHFLTFLKNLAVVTFSQMVTVFGLLFLFGLILYFISRFTRKVYVNSGIPKADIYFTGWIGTPIHELGHAFFCIVFGHKIKDMKLFSPNKAEGTIGYVVHSYDSKNIYHLLGNFFIGTGPLLFGSGVLFVVMYFLLPNSSEIISVMSQKTMGSLNLSQIVKTLIEMGKMGVELTKIICSPSNFSMPQFWVFIYISLCISSHMQLSPPDIKSMLRGLLVILGVFMVINIVALVWEFDINSFIVTHSNFGLLYVLFVLSIVISLVNFVFTYCLAAIFYGLKKRKLLLVF